MALRSPDPDWPPIRSVVWAPIPDTNEMYEVSSDGDVRSWQTPGPGKRRAETPRLKAVNFNHAGYPMVHIVRSGRATWPRVHQLVLEAFRGPRPEGHEGSHLDGNKLNNELSNLVWKTHADNMADRHEHGTIPRGVTHPRAKLTEAQVQSARDLRSEGWFLKDIAKELGVSRSTIGCLIRGRTWKHLV